MDTAHTVTDMPCIFVLCLAESELTCGPPPKIAHGIYSRIQQKYLLNDRVKYYCNPGYYLWGEQTLVCTALVNIGDWLPGNCPSYPYCTITHPECLLATQYDEKCIQKTGHHATINNEAFCDPSSQGTADNRVQSMCQVGCGVYRDTASGTSP